MKPTGRLPILLLFLLLALAGRAQQPRPFSNLRFRTFALAADSIRLDTLSIVPKTLQVEGVADSLFRLDEVRAILYWKQRPQGDSVRLRYRVFPYRLDASLQRISYDSVVNHFYIKPYTFRQGEGERAGGLFNFGNLQYNGSFGRALSFGNNQDAVVNSNFQLQLNGMLGDSIEVAAALTDNNIPIQPDGTTQQLNEFDQVFLQFRKRGWQLNLGDIDLRQNSLYFLNFYKRLQGVSFQNNNRLTEHLQSNTLVSGSIAKGKFTRNVFQGLEGNQGPYRLSGANNEFFFVVLAGTERVFLDGELLQRGDDADYIINYNTAEVTFMPRRMITKDSRIQIEFEYADRNYLNANLYLFQEVGVGSRLKLRLGAFQNSDARNSPINQTLDAPQKQFLFELGDSIGKALYPTVGTDTFATDKILYEKVYFENNGETDSFYRYSIDPATARFALSFTELGEGRGDYVPDFNGANGKVYRYVAPVNGQPQGRFAPVLVLVTPKKQQLVSFGADYQLNERNALKTELAMSNQDLNTYSSKNGGDDAGLAARLQYVNTLPLAPARDLRLQTTFDYELVQQQFRPLERLRYVEFTREWGLPLLTAPADEQIIRLATEMKDKRNHALRYQFTRYTRSDAYSGVQNLLQHTADLKGWNFNNQVAVTRFTSGSDKGTFWRPIADVSKQLKSAGNWRVGARYALEQNEVRHARTDTLSPLSFSFDTWSAYIKSDEAKKNRYGLTFFTRADKYPLRKEMQKGDRSYNVNLAAELLGNERHQLLFNTTYRVLKVYDKMISQQEEDRTLLGRAEYLVNEWKGLLTGSVLYELGTGQEQRRDFAYLEVPAGQGEYTWNDYNSDNIQQLNEFEVALFQDQAKFIRIFVPTNQFLKANFTTLNYQFVLQPRALLNRADLKGLQKLVSRFQLQTSLQKNKKTTASSEEFDMNPFASSLQDTALITLNTSLSNTLSFNRYSSVWGIDLSNLQQTGRALLTYGYESRSLRDWIAKLRWNLSPALTFDLQGRSGRQALFTPKFGNRNYDLSVRRAEPRLTFIKGTVFRLQGSYRLESKKNRPTWGGEEAFSQAIELESKYNVLQNSSIATRFTYNKIRYDHPTNSTVAYIMLDGLLPGRNFLWSIDLTKRLLNNVELNLQYEGRKPGDTRTIHIGRAAIRALL